MALNDTIRRYVVELLARYKTLSEELAQPEIYEDRERYLALSRRHGELKSVVDIHKRIQAIEADLATAVDMLAHESDPDLQTYLNNEIRELEAEQSRLERHLVTLIVPPDPRDQRNVILEIRAGTGGEEAALFAADLLRMYLRYCENRNWRADIVEANPTTLGGFKEVIVIIEGQKVYSHLKFESGVHRVQRVPRTESGGRIHTSAVSVAILPEAEDLEVAIAEKDLRIDVFSASGPGGQHVNKSMTAIRITHLPTGIIVSCQDERTLGANRKKALRVLRARLNEYHRRQQEAERASERRAQVGRGDRSEKVRTYNFPQNRVTDHRLGLTLYQLDAILNGELDLVIDPLRAEENLARLKSLTA